MIHDLVVRGGTVVDGTGGAPVAADVAIDGGTISAVGRVDDTGAHEIDASGHIVTPGFIDIHSHLDAQVGWDPLLTPTSSHGVTTALLGNCGVTFAPCKPNDREMLAGMMESVEDIPAQAILSGLPWNWESYGEYLDSIEALEPAINLIGLVGHCAIRPYVMGERGVADTPTDAECTAMARVITEAMEAGAVGFSTSRFPFHYLPDGRHVPGTHAHHDELVGFAEAMGSTGLSQVVPNITDFGNEFDLLRRLADAAGGQVLFSTGVNNSPESGELMAGIVGGLRDEGCQVTGLCIPRASGLVIGLVNQLYFKGRSWKRLLTMDFDSRLAAIGDQAFFAELVADAETHPPPRRPPPSTRWATTCRATPTESTRACRRWPTRPANTRPPRSCA